VRAARHGLQADTFAANIKAVPMRKTEAKTPQGDTPQSSTDKPVQQPSAKPAKEVGGRDGLDPTRYVDWEKNGRAVDF
jgi:hypothetical protein